VQDAAAIEEINAIKKRTLRIVYGFLMINAHDKLNAPKVHCMGSSVLSAYSYDTVLTSSVIAKPRPSRREESRYPAETYNNTIERVASTVTRYCYYEQFHGDS
jgi:hypothetical protein